MTTLYIILFVIIGILISLIIFIVKRSIAIISVYEKFILDRRERYTTLLSKIQEIDSRQLFEKDDDVGSIFDELKVEIESFEKILE